MRQSSKALTYAIGVWSLQHGSVQVTLDVHQRFCAVGTVASRWFSLPAMCTRAAVPTQCTVAMMYRAGRQQSVCSRVRVDMAHMRGCCRVWQVFGCLRWGSGWAQTYLTLFRTEKKKGPKAFLSTSGSFADEATSPDISPESFELFSHDSEVVTSSDDVIE